VKPEPPGDEEYKEYEKLIDGMFAQIQEGVDPLRFVVASVKEKPLDDIHDYKNDLSP